MKTPFFLIMFSTLSWAAQANEFRNIALGDNCRVIESNETSIGSIPKDVWRRNDGEYIFEGNFQGYDAKIIYNCFNGNLIKGTYIIKSSSIENAESIFSQLRQYFKTIYGEPIVDTTKSNTQEIMKTLEISGVVKTSEAIISWEKTSYQVGLSLHDSADSKPVIMGYIK